MNIMIISGGNINSDFALDFIGKMKPDYTIGVDRGLVFARKWGLHLDCIVGDFDSVPAEIIAKYRTEQKVPIRTYKPEKDDTDTEIAINKALSLPEGDIWILGATGTRLDHVLGNIQCLKLALERGRRAYIVDEYNKICLVGAGEHLTIRREDQFGQYVSFLPLGEQASEVTLEGFKYSLKSAVITNGNSLGVSNQIAEEEAHVSIGQGILVMVQSRD